MKGEVQKEIKGIKSTVRPENEDDARPKTCNSMTENVRCFYIHSTVLLSWILKIKKVTYNCITQKRSLV